MSELFILQNQDKLFLGRQKEWLDGRDPGSLYKTRHKDEAVNQMVEASSKDYTQRIKVLQCGVSEKGLPIIDPELMPPPLPKMVKSKGGEVLISSDEQVEQELDAEGELDIEGEADASTQLADKDFFTGEQFDQETDAAPKEADDTQASLL